MGAYDADKAGRHYESLSLLQKGLQPYPVHVQLIPTDYCNQDCGFCAYRSSNYDGNPLFKIIEADGTVNHNPRRSIPWEKMQEIISDCGKMGVKAILLTGGGEPTLYREFPQLLRKIQEVGIDFAVQSNGVLAGKDSLKGLREAAWLRFSIDSGTAATYAFVRRVVKAEFELVWRNVQKLAAVPNRVQTIGVGYVVTKENHEEIFLAAKRAVESGVDNIRISAALQSDHDRYYDGILEKIEEQLAATLELQSDSFQVFNNFTLRYSDLVLGSPDYTRCGYMNFTTYIGGDQKVYTCCMNAYNKKGEIGSVEKIGFKELWDSPEKQEFFRRFDAHNCSRCMFNNRNRAIEKILLPTKSHENFV